MEYTDPKTGKFTKGNPGRPVGAKSERAKIWSEIGEWFKSEGLEAYKDKLIEMQRNDPAEFMKRYETMLEYFAPKLSRSNIDHSSTDGTMSPRTLSDFYASHDEPRTKGVLGDTKQD